MPSFAQEVEHDVHAAPGWFDRWINADSFGCDRE